MTNISKHVGRELTSDKLVQKSPAKTESVTVEISDSELDRVAGGVIIRGPHGGAYAGRPGGVHA